MYFNFALNLYMILSSADNPSKQFRPKSGPIICPDLIGVQTVWRFRGYDKLELNQCFIFIWNIYIDFVSRWHLGINVSNNLDPDQAQHSVWTWSVSKLFDTLEVMSSWSWTDVFNFALNLNMTLSSADNPFKQFRPRSGPTFCPDLIGVQTVWNFRGNDKLKLNRCILTLR